MTREPEAQIARRIEQAPEFSGRAGPNVQPAGAHLRIVPPPAPGIPDDDLLAIPPFLDRRRGRTPWSAAQSAAIDPGSQHPGQRAGTAGTSLELRGGVQATPPGDTTIGSAKDEHTTNGPVAAGDSFDLPTESSTPQEGRPATGDVADTGAMPLLQYDQRRSAEPAPTPAGNTDAASAELVNPKPKSWTKPRMKTPPLPGDGDDGTKAVESHAEEAKSDEPDGGEPAATASAGAGLEADDEVDLDAVIADLAKLSPLEYDQLRQPKANRLKVRVSTLDNAVAKVRGEGDGGKPGQGRPLELPTPEPWSEPVNGVALLDELVATFRRFLVLRPGAAEALALWVMHAHTFDASPITPRLAITSPDKRCGKTTLLDVLRLLVPKPLSASNITAAAVFRTIELARPTLLIDEADTFLQDNEELRGVLNSGHARNGCVIRTVGDDHEPRIFSTFAPVVVALIGKLPATLADRSIEVAMRRKRPDEKIERLKPKAFAAILDLARRCARWAADYRSGLVDVDPAVPEVLNDRAADNWRPLLAIADLAGGEWPERARGIAAAAVGADEDTAPIMLLADLRRIFARRAAERLPSAALCAELAEMESRPWPEWNRGKPITARQMAKLLGPFGISPGTIRAGDGSTPKGYQREAFKDAFARYLPPEEQIDPPHRHKPQDSAENQGNQSATTPPDVADRNSQNPRDSAACGGVADEKGEVDERVESWTG